jgi:exopolysaccharide biosynthesis protein
MIAALLLAAANVLPLSPRPAPPFPKIVTDAPVFSDVAPGVTYGNYQMLTADGPLSVHVLAVDVHNAHVHIGTALANEHMVSPGETVSSMAHRTGAVAGVNADYFDINQTNQPLNILIENGKLVRMPMQRWALAFGKDGTPQFAEFNVTAQALLESGPVPLKTINDWPPPGGGTVLITADYGPLHPADNVTEYTLQLLSGTPPFATYRITGTGDASVAQQPGYYLAIGPQAYGTFPLPNEGDTLTVQGTATPPIDTLENAIGGGPLLVKDGAWYADPDGPSKGEWLTHMPITSAGVTRDGTLLLFEIDGRQPALSIGVLQPQLAALMISFGVQTGLQFDGGGSSTMVARLPGDVGAVVQNSPSDGTERRVGDALLVYSDAPYGPPAKIASMPQAIRALPGARVPLRIAVTDAADHTLPVCRCDVHLRVVPESAGRIEGDTFIAGAHPEDAVIRVTAAALHADVPVYVTQAVARAEILPPFAAARANDELHVTARAFDAKGYAIALPDTLPWQAQNARVDDRGNVELGARDATVSVQLGNKLVSEAVTVGEHAQSVALQNPQFASAPRGGPGSIEVPSNCANCAALHYDFTGSERAAYVDTAVLLPQRALAIQAEVYGDGNGEILRMAVNNAINERFLYTLAKIDWNGWRRVEFRFPAALPQPITLKSLYVINRVGPGPAVSAAGAISIRNLQVVLAGSAQTANK